MKIRKLIVFFLLSHWWWIVFVFVSNLCMGGIDSGFSCSVPIEGLANFTGFSVFFLAPLWPIFFYSYLITRFIKKLLRDNYENVDTYPGVSSQGTLIKIWHALFGFSIVRVIIFAVLFTLFFSILVLLTS